MNKKGEGFFISWKLAGNFGNLGTLLINVDCWLDFDISADVTGGMGWQT